MVLFFFSERIRIMNENPIRTRLKANDFFGDEVLTRGEVKNYKSNVVATTTTTCWLGEKQAIKVQVKQMRTNKNKRNDLTYSDSIDSSSERP